MLKNRYFKPRDIVKLAFQYQENEYVPYNLILSREQEKTLVKHYGYEEWKDKKVDYLGFVTGVDTYLELGKSINCVDTSVGTADLSLLKENSILEDKFGCKWKIGTTHHLMDFPLKEPCMKKYKLPELKLFFENQLKPRWQNDILRTKDQFRIIIHVFGLFERAWSLRGFENLLMDMVKNTKFVKELLDAITEWLIHSVDLMSAAPIDAIMFTDDHAGQNGMLMGAERWRELFKPRWEKIYDRVHNYGLYSIMHMCGDNTEVIPDLIEIGLDCMESCQPEAEDIYELKKKYGGNIRFWGGLGVQSTFTFGSTDEIKNEIRRLKNDMGKNGGYILASAKAPMEDVPIENIVAFLEEANKPFER